MSFSRRLMYALDSFEDNSIVLSMVILEELDHFKKVEAEIGANARRGIRYLEQKRLKGDLLKMVSLENGGPGISRPHPCG